MALFGNTRPPTSSTNLVEFRAGKMTLNPQSSMVTPDKRKGLVYMNQSEDTLMHFCWKDRTSGTVEDDLIIFPGDAQFARCKSSKNNRVFIMKMKDTGRKYFFWMQEPKEDKDEELYKKVNDFLNNGPTAASSSSGSVRAGGGGLSRARLGRGAAGGFGSGGTSAMPGGLDSLTPDQMALMQQMFTSGGAGLSPGDINSEALDAAFGGLDQQQFWQLFSLMGGANSLGGSGGAGAGLSALASAGLGGDSGSAGIGDTPNTGGLGDTPSQISTPASAEPPSSTPAAPAGDRTASRVQLSDLQSILANMNLPAEARSTGDSSGAALAAALAGSSEDAATGEDIQSNEELIAASNKDKDKKDSKGKDKSPGDKKDDKGPNDEEMELD